MPNGSLRLARGRGGAPLSLAICGVLALVLVLLGRVQPTLFDRIRAFASDRAAPVLEVVRVPFHAVGEWVGGLGNVFSVYQENLRLKQENARLRQWQNAALVLDQRLKRYRLLLNAVPDPELASVTAHVIGRASRPFLDTMILDAGRREHIKPGAAVVDDRGMIGRIFLAGDHTSWVILLTDLNSRIPVSIQPGNVQAIMAGDNSAAPVLEGSAQGVYLHEGQQIVTSGDGALLPAGLLIGKVFWDGGAFRAGLYADAGHSDDVRVLDLKLPAEQLPAVSNGDLPVTAAGLAPLTPPPPKITQPATQAPPTTSPPSVKPIAPPTTSANKPPPPPAADDSNSNPAPDDQ
ncbi:MAG TPA: rod shape-determining protein MreC [Rhizomicrobium sp.]|jgi:rod shape-determining protein MreC